jgi:aminoglycoside phosphotransferase
MSEATYISWAADRLNVAEPAVKRARSGDNSTAFEIEAGDGRNPRLRRSIVQMLASALRAFHSLSASDCPFEAYVPGESIVYSDACLPNIIAGDDGMNAYIDLGDMGEAPQAARNAVTPATAAAISGRASPGSVVMRSGSQPGKHRRIRELPRQSTDANGSAVGQAGDSQRFPRGSFR